MKIKELRKLCGMTQREFAVKYNIPESTIGGMENRGRKTLTETLLNRAVLEDLDENFPKPPYCLGFNINRILDYSHMTQKSLRTNMAYQKLN